VRLNQINQTQLSPINLSFAEQPILIIPSNNIKYPDEKLHHLMTNSPTRPQSANVSYSASSPQRPGSVTVSPLRPATAPEPSNNVMEHFPKYDTKLLNIVRGIGHMDAYVAHASLNELADILESPEKQAVLRDYEEIYIQSVLDQFKV
jgi:cytoskeleton-associated protein 5